MFPIIWRTTCALRAYKLPWYKIKWLSSFFEISFHPWFQSDWSVFGRFFYGGMPKTTNFRFYRSIKLLNALIPPFEYSVVPQSFYRKEWSSLRSEKLILKMNLLNSMSWEIALISLLWFLRSNVLRFRLNSLQDGKTYDMSMLQYEYIRLQSENLLTRKLHASWNKIWA